MRMKHLITAIISVVLLSSCRTIKTVERIENEVPIEQRYHKISDIYKLDSIFINTETNTYTKYDTVYKDRYITKHEIHNQYVRDTVRDTVQVPVKITVTKTNTEYTNILKWWQKALMFLGLIFILYIVIKLIRR